MYISVIHLSSGLERDLLLNIKDTKGQVVEFIPDKTKCHASDKFIFPRDIT